MDTLKLLGISNYKDNGLFASVKLPTLLENLTGAKATERFLPLKMPAKLKDVFCRKISPDSMQLLFEENRRKTFQTWVFSDDKKCNLAKLAEAGFYFKENPDVVQCFLCDKILDGWEENDDPWSEHISHAPYCTFAKLQKAEKSLTLYQLFDIQVELFTKTVEEEMTRRETEFVARSREFRKSLMHVKRNV